MDRTADRRGPLERFLSLFAEVRAGEARGVLLLTLNVFLILTAYYIIKPVREALILSVEGGAELKSYSGALQAAILIVVVPLYARLAGAVPRRVLINATNLFFISNLVLFYLMARSVPNLGVVFYLWVGIFNLMVPSLFWSFANDVYTEEQGKRLFAIVAFGASAGAALGGLITQALVEPLGVFQLLLVSAALLGAALAITNAVERSEAPAAKSKETEPAPAKGDAFQLIFRRRYLLLIALLMLFLNWVNTNGEYILGRVVAEVAEKDGMAQGLAGDALLQFRRTAVAGFYAGFFTWVNVAALLLQAFVVSRILKYVGIPIAILILPLIALTGYSLLVFVPVLAVIRYSKMAENATDYSLQNTVRHALFLPTTREEKYKAKQAIDSFFVRMGDALSAGLVYAGTAWLALGTGGFARVNLALVVIWFLLALAVGKQYKGLTREAIASAP